MTSFGGNTGSISGHRLPARRWSRALQAAAIALSVMVLSTGTPVAAAPTSTAHVYLLRGVLNIFSMGLDDIAAKLEAQGIPVTGLRSPSKPPRTTRAGR
jgi:hypothetical protein